MTPNYCQRHGFHLCQTCDTPTAIFTCQSHLKQHITKKHSRVETNSKLVANIYRHTTPENEANWKTSLSYLFNLELTPPPFRRTTWHKLKQPIRAEFYNVYNNVVSWIIDASPIMSPAIIRDDRPPQHECDSSPFWKLLLMLEPMLLAPIKGTVHLTYSNAFKARLSMFKQGRIEELHQTTWNPTPLPPTHHRHQSTKSKQQQQRRQQQHQTDNKLPTWRLRSAQQAADLGNYRAAFQRLTTNTPTATLTPPRIQRCKDELFPPRRQPPPSTRAQGQTGDPPPANQYLRLEDSNFELALRQMKPGTASGPFANCIDAIVSMALHRTTKAANSTRPYFGKIKTLLQLVVTAQVPPSIQTLLASNYFLALHKDLSNLEKLRPIGIGTAIRRVAAKTALVHVTEHISPILLKGGQYGIQIPGGVDVVAQTTAAAVRKFITRQNDTKDTTSNQPPTRSLLLLDLTNMFNNVSRTEARRILLSDDATKPLVPIFDLLTSKPCKSWYFDENKKPQHLWQEEGFPQGCPLSPLFSCLVLLALTNKINKEQAQRAAKRKQQDIPYDDEMGGLAHTASIMDDTSVCLPHADLPWFLQRFQELGTPLGIILNHNKTNILTSTTGESPIERLSPSQRQGLKEALTFLSPTSPEKAEITTGVRFLGQPIGSSNFARQYIASKIAKLENKLDKLHQLHDLQTKHTLFRFSLVSSILHLLPADITLANPAGRPTSTLWTSPTTIKMERLIATFLARLTSTPIDMVLVPSTLIASLPQRLGGTGYQNAAAAAYPRFLTQTARAIAMAHSEHSPLPTVHQQTYRNWQENTSPEMTKFRKALSLFANEYADESLFTVERFDRSTHNRQMDHILKEHVIPKIFRATKPDQRIFLPSVLSPLTSMPFSVPLSASDFRLDNKVFTTALKRKLRLPLHFDHPCNDLQSCKCSKPLDPHGDHLFGCSQASKTALSNAIRDTLYDVLRHLAPAAKVVDTPHDVHVEPPGLAPMHNRNIRPADVGLLLSQPHNNDEFQYLAIDVTVPPPQQPTPTLDPSDHQQLTAHASRTHQESARAKYCRDPETAKHLLHNGVYLLPFTVDHLGSLGSFAETLLFSSDNNPHPFSTAHPPDWQDPHFGRNASRSLSHPAAFALYQHLRHAPSKIISTANKDITTFCYPAANVYSLGHFAKLSLSHAIVSSLATHANTHMATIRNHKAKTTTRTSQIQNLARLGFAPVTPIYSPIPMEEYVHLTDNAPLLCDLPA